MSFFFRAASRPRQPQQELVRSIKDSLLALDTKTGAKVLLPSLAAPPSVAISVHLLARSAHSDSRLAPGYPNWDRGWDPSDCSRDRAVFVGAWSAGVCLVL